MGYILKGTGKITLNAPISKAAIDACQGGTIMWNPAMVKNSGGDNAVASQVVLGKPAYSPPCTAQGIVQSQQAMQKMFRAFVGLDDPNQFGNFMKGLAGVSARNAYIGCIRVAAPFFNAETTVNSQVTSTVCTNKNSSSPQYLSDPCCNHKLRWSQCCNPRQVQQSYKILGTVKPAVVAQKCNHPKEITKMLQAFRRTHNNNQKPTGKCLARFNKNFDSQAFQERSKFKSTCQTELFTSRTCVSDADCSKYGPLSCVEEGWNTKNFKCEQPWGNPDPYLLSCYIKNMDNRTNAFNRADWGLQPSTTKDQYEKEFRRRMTSVDCYGPDTDPKCIITNINQPGSCNGDNIWWDSNAQACVDGASSRDPAACRAKANRRMVIKRSFTTYKRNLATGNYEPTYVPGNRTECLLRKVCSYNLWEQGMTKTKCENKLGPVENGKKFFCGICWGPYCSDVTIPSICYNQRMTQQQCQAAGAGWAYQKNQWGQQRCVRTGVTTQAACLPTNISPAGGPTKDQVWGDSQWRCSQDLCYTNDTQQGCQTRGFGYYWNNRMANGNGLCVSWNKQMKSQCDAAGASHSWWTGLSFQNGLLDTRQKCAKGVCSFDTSLSETDCKARNYCTQRCQTCQSNQYEKEKKVLCKGTATNSSACKVAKGTWDSTDNMCVMTSEFGTKQTCEANAGFMWFSCRQYNENSCNNVAGPRRYMQCAWQKWGECPDAMSCQKSGVCNDYGMRGGGCFTPMIQSDQGHSKCPVNTQQVDRIYCKDKSKNSTQCKQAGAPFKWFPGQARNKTQCEAYGSSCFDLWGNKRGHPTPQACRACGFQWRSNYEWTSGIFGPGFMKNGTWRMREYRSFNSWGPTMNRSRVDSMANKAILSDMGQTAASLYRCIYNPIFFALKTVACDCGSNKGANCFQKTVNLQDLKVAEDLFIPGKDISLGNEVGTVTIPGSASSKYSTVSVAVVPSEVFANPNATTTGNNAIVNALMSVFAPRAVGNSAEYAVIKNSNGATVGQLVSSGVNVASTQSFENPVTVCVSPNSDIDIDTTSYPTKDFSKGDNANAPGVPMTKTVTVTNGQYCFQATEPGTYYAINRITNFGSITPTPTPTATPTASATPTPTPDATASAASHVSTSVFAIVVAFVVALMM
eukprot:TRINITY_DN5698_c0_g1_i1.p1 TRINITY_DN5698_c0_g1~~TRINITY_DN5698_c0_g1_i1.p1  ORF type:complete len:1139 (-),score=312.12 TRINITY_DN5698_c0_g1_i1:30-3446(-)